MGTFPPYGPKAGKNHKGTVLSKFVRFAKKIRTTVRIFVRTLFSTNLGRKINYQPEIVYKSSLGRVFDPTGTTGTIFTLRILKTCLNSLKHGKNTFSSRIRIF